MQRPRTIAATPRLVCDPAVAIAASRAGGIGILDLEACGDDRVVGKALEALVRYGRGDIGIRICASDARLASDAFVPREVGWVVLAGATRDNVDSALSHLKRQGKQMLLEAASLEQALLGQDRGVHGAIARGNESGGWVAEESSFVLLQTLLARTSLRVWVQGGIGLHSAASCYAAGASGVVLDSQLALTRESALPEPARAAIARMDGSETACLGYELGEPFRFYARPGLPVVDEVRALAQELGADPRPLAERAAQWRAELGKRLGWASPERQLWPLGQDAAFAAPLAGRFRTVGGILQAVGEAASSHVRIAARARPLDQDSPLATAHGTRFPIVQGPMTRVSDVPAFAAAVTRAGGLPLLAVALLRRQELEEMLAKTHELAAGGSWGVGLLTFIEPDLFEEQMAVIRARRPRFALLAGGQPEQARALEEIGIDTYLHVPSPGLLELFLQSGSRHFVFEGSECGGHVGPRSSFVLWNTMVDTLLAHVPAAEVKHCRIVLAGGIHDARSAAAAVTATAPLLELGAQVGVLMGTAYLFTKEAVSAGAIRPGFQKEAIRCSRTVLLETGPGHAIRCSETPFTAEFGRLRRRLLAEKMPAGRVKEELERINLGRLRIASKGIARSAAFGKEEGAPKFTELDEAEQLAQGVYMIGQVAALRDSTRKIETLHKEVSRDGSRWLDKAAEEDVAATAAARDKAAPSDVAIVGMACILPKAADLQTYWENILGKVDAITEVPRDRWDPALYYDSDRDSRDKVYSKWGGFLDPVPFDPVRYGMPPSTLPSIEPSQLLALEVVRNALEDAGYGQRPFARERTSVIVGAGGGMSDLGQLYSFRANLPTFFEHVPEEVLDRLPEWTEDSFPGTLVNVIAGRIANRLDLGGANFTVDAACASSLAAVHLAVRELETGSSDMVIAGAVDTINNPHAYLCFSKTRALSPRGRCRTFDAATDGIVISEGICALVLKRLSDAERDGDRIYAVIKAVGASSDGRDKGLTAPRPAGQVRALHRAYGKAGFTPSTVGLIEAHGTGTVAGDNAEVETLRRVFEANGAQQQGCAIGSVKSMIGHTKNAAGVAGLIKVAQALYHKVLPPTMGVDNPNPTIAGSPFFVNTEARPWVHAGDAHPRRAGVSAFGFGGTNFHTVLEEYVGDYRRADDTAVVSRWDSELFLWAAPASAGIAAKLEALEGALAAGAAPRMRDLAFTTWQLHRASPGHRLAVVASSLEDLRKKLQSAIAHLRAKPGAALKDPSGIYYTEAPLAASGRIAFLFPGQGSQYPDMHGEIASFFAEARSSFELADRVLDGRWPRPLSRFIYPPTRFTKEEEQQAQAALTRTDVAQPALGASAMALLHVLDSLGVTPDMVAGHSYGEYAALCAAGVFDEATLYAVSEARGRFILEAAKGDLGTMAAVKADRAATEAALAGLQGVWVANLNSPSQTIISGTRGGIEGAQRRLAGRGLECRPIPVSCAFHSPIVSPARDLLADFLARLEARAPRLEVFSNTTAAPYPGEPAAILALLGDHLVRPVDFVGEVRAMHERGARIFVEVGPRNVLTSLTQATLKEQPHLAVALDAAGKPGVMQLQHALGQLAVHGVPAQLDRLYRGRQARLLNLDALAEETRPKPLPSTTWMVDGGKARPLDPAKAAGIRVPTTLVRTAPESSGDKQTERTVTAMVESQVPRFPEGRLPQDDGASRILLQHQQLMARFLEAQKQVMLAYLGGAASQAPAPQDDLQAAAELILPPDNGHAEPVLRPVQAAPVQAAQAPAPAPSREPAPSAPPRAQAAAASAQSPALAPAAAAAAAQSPINGGAQVDREQLTNRLREIVSDRTGFPTEMLNLDLDMEADLGIDSIKRAEILGTLRRTFLASTQLANIDALSKIKTLKGIVDWICDSLQQPDAKKKELTAK